MTTPRQDVLQIKGVGNSVHVTNPTNPREDTHMELTLIGLLIFAAFIGFMVWQQNEPKRIERSEDYMAARMEILRLKKEADPTNGEAYREWRSYRDRMIALGHNPDKRV